MKTETLGERNIDSATQGLRLTADEKGDRGAAQTGEFLELAPAPKNVLKSPCASPAQRRQIANAQNTCAADVESCLPGDVPFSFLACILALPEKIQDWPDMDTVQRILLHLLSDQGFLFWEVFPTANGQYTIPDFVGMTDANKENTDVNHDLWTETQMISYIQNEFYSNSRRWSENWQGRIEQDLHQPELFRKCIVKMVGSVLQKSQKCQELSFYENRLIDFCREDLHIPEQQLYENSDGDSTSGEGVPSLRDALSDLAKICFDLAARVEDQVIRLAPMASQETYRRYKEFQKNYGHLEQDLQCRELLLCSSRNLMPAICINLTDWYQHVDDEQLMRMKNPVDRGERSTQGRAKVRVNRKLNADKERALPQNFDFSWLRGGLEDYQSAALTNCSEHTVEESGDYCTRNEAFFTIM